MERDTSYDYFYAAIPDLELIEEPISVLSFIEHSEKRNKELEFRLLKKMTETKRHIDLLVENSPEIQQYNRYSDILPFKDTSVTFSNESYINANWIKGLSDTQNFIATQGPLESTRESFWRMVWDNQVSLIVMISALREAGKVKCDEYFPQSGSLEVEKFQIELLRMENEFPSLTVRRFLVTSTESCEYREVLHVECVAWPDHGTPDLKQEYESLLFLLGLFGEYSSDPVIVHCSAGIGRTGTLIALYIMIRTIEEKAENAEISVFGTVRKLREQRWGMVETKLQYEFLYNFMCFYLKHYFKL